MLKTGNRELLRSVRKPSLGQRASLLTVATVLTAFYPNLLCRGKINERTRRRYKWIWLISAPHILPDNLHCVLHLDKINHVSGASQKLCYAWVCSIIPCCTVITTPRSMHAQPISFLLRHYFDWAVHIGDSQIMDPFSVPSCLPLVYVDSVVN